VLLGNTTSSLRFSALFHLIRLRQQPARCKIVTKKYNNWVIECTLFACGSNVCIIYEGQVGKTINHRTRSLRFVDTSQLSADLSTHYDTTVASVVFYCCQLNSTGVWTNLITRSCRSVGNFRTSLTRNMQQTF
jgi:hypothetical protein